MVCLMVERLKAKMLNIEAYRSKPDEVLNA
jgi:hypothetical protein